MRILISAKDRASGVLQGVSKSFKDIRTQIAGLMVGLGMVGQAMGAIGAAAALEDLVAQFAALEGGAEAGARKLKEIEGAFGLRQVDTATRLYAQLAAFGLKPTVEQLGDLIDFNARTGQGAENLNGIVAQLGQAWGKQKLQYEDILVLLERGVPVWDLLGNATGVATDKLVDMASRGELGRKAISLLIAEMGKVGEGAAAARLTTWNGLVESASGLWTRFQATLANAGVFEQAKGYLSGIADALERAITDGSAARWGAQIAEAAATIGERLKELLGTARQFWADWTTGIAGWGAGTRQVLSGIEQQKQAAAGVAKASEDAAAGAEDWRLDMAALNEELQRAGVLITQDTAATSAQAEAAKQAGAAMGTAAAGTKLGADALRDHAVASKEATEASKETTEASKDLADGQATGIVNWGAVTRQVLSSIEAAWLTFRAAVEAVAAGVAAVLGVTQGRFAQIHAAMASVGLISEATAARSRIAAETMIEAAADYAAASKQHFAEAGQAALAAVGQQEQAAAGVAKASEDAAAGAEDWRLDMAALNAELQRAGVLITQDTAATRAQAEAAKQAGAATGAAAAGTKLGADALRDHAAASKEAGEAAKELADAQADLAKAQHAKASEKDPYGWEDAAMAASRAASEISGGQADKAIRTITEAYLGLADAVARGDTSAGIEVVARQLDELAKRAEKASSAVKDVAQGGTSSGEGDTKEPAKAADDGSFVSASAKAAALAEAYRDLGIEATNAGQAVSDLDRQADAAGARRQGKADTKGGDEEAGKTGERAAVEQQFAKPIPLTFDVAAGAAAAATQVADIIITTVQQRLAGAAFSVPVTAIVTVDTGGADEISLESAKRGSRTP